MSLEEGDWEVGKGGGEEAEAEGTTQGSGLKRQRDSKTSPDIGLRSAEKEQQRERSQEGRDLRIKRLK